MPSWIQNHILLELTKHGTCRYTELRPRDVEGNLFMYYLKGLTREGLVEKADKMYQLTPKGIQHVSHLSLSTGKMRQQPKILTMVVCKNNAGNYLFSRWHRQPNKGLVSFPHGMMHIGESVVDMAALELAEKAALEATLIYRGNIYLRVTRGSNLNDHMLVHVFHAQNPRPGRQGELRPEVSEPFWAPLDSLQQNDFVPGFYEVARFIHETPTGHIFKEITCYS